VRQVGHSSFTSNHCARHSSWKWCLHGVVIAVTSSFSGCSVSSVISESAWTSPEGAASKMFCRQIEH
jgi:hypothetical protein